MKVNIAVINAFVDADKGGNPAGVVLEADQLSDKHKLSIAKKLGLSETAFVSKSNTADFKLDFYTPEKQIAHCGHATIATFSHLSQLGLVHTQQTSKETIEGNRRIEVLGEFAYMEQTKPKYFDIHDDIKSIYLAIGLNPKQAVSAPAIVNTGNSFLIIGVKTINDLESLMPDYKKIRDLSERYNLIGFYVFTLETNLADRDASTRMFAPRYGIKEESATGMAAGPLACFLYDRLNIDKDSFNIEQGFSMQPASPSCIKVLLSREEGVIISLKAGGIGRLSRYEEIDI